MISFDFKKFLIDNRKSKNDLAKLLNSPITSIIYMVERGTVKPSFLALLESHFGNLNTYIKDKEHSRTYAN